MSIPGAPNPVKWSDIYNTITGTIHNGSTSIKISDYIGQIWSDNTFVPSKDISIDKHFRGKSMPAGELEIEMPPGGVANNLLETYWPFYGLYNYGQSAFYYSSSLLSLTKLKTNDQITAIEFEIFAPENAEPGKSGYLYPRNQEIWIGQANPDNNIFWYRTQANFEGTRENQPVKFDKPLAQYKNWNFDSTNQPLIPGTQKVKLILDNPFIPTIHNSGFIIVWKNNHGKYRDLSYWNLSMKGVTSPTYIDPSYINSAGSYSNPTRGGVSKTWYDDYAINMPEEYYGKLNGLCYVKFYYKDGGGGLSFVPGGGGGGGEKPPEIER